MCIILYTELVMNQFGIGNDLRKELEKRIRML